MEEGWVKLHRKFLEWEWHDSPEMVSMFVHLLMLANHEEGRWHGETIHRGQILTSRERLSETTGLTVQQVRTCLSRFEQTGEIVRKSTNRKTIITISNYDRYQVGEETEQPAINQQITSNQPANNQQSTTNKNEKNKYNIIQDNNTHARARDWRCLSSLEKEVCGYDKDRMASMKRDIFRAQAQALAPQLGMPADQLDDFIRWWTEHNAGDDRIKAEYQVTFDMSERMAKWMKGQSRRQTPAHQQAPQPKSRMDIYQEDMQHIHNFFHGNEQQDTNPDIQ